MGKSYVPFDKDQLDEILGKSYPHGVLCMNLLKFRKQVTIEGEDLSGMEAYRKYVETTIHTIPEVGGAIVAFGECEYAVIGPKGEWDMMAIVWYPSAEAFHNMISSERYRSAVHYRTLALEDSRLIPVPAPPGYTPSISAVELTPNGEIVVRE
jgi:uncharacterized protein (DUF1330 family)